VRLLLRDQQGNKNSQTLGDEGGEEVHNHEFKYSHCKCKIRTKLQKLHDSTRVGTSLTFMKRGF